MRWRRSVGRDNPFQVGGELRRKADLMLARSRITRSELYIVDPDLTQSESVAASAIHSDDTEFNECNVIRRQRPASDCLPVPGKAQSVH